MSRYLNNKAYKERNKISNLYINLPEDVKKNFKVICAVLDTDMSSVIRPHIDKFIKKNANLIK